CQRSSSSSTASARTSGMASPPSRPRHYNRIRCRLRGPASACRVTGRMAPRQGKPAETTMTRNKKTLILLGAALLAAAGAAAARRREVREGLRAYAQAHDGPVDRGREVSLALGCASCHGADGGGTRRGPDLRGISARYDRAEIIRSVLEPSARFAPGWQTV